MIISIWNLETNKNAFIQRNSKSLTFVYGKYLSQIKNFEIFVGTRTLTFVFWCLLRALFDPVSTIFWIYIKLSLEWGIRWLYLKKYCLCDFLLLELQGAECWRQHLKWHPLKKNFLQTLFSDSASIFVA